MTDEATSHDNGARRADAPLKSNDSSPPALDARDAAFVDAYLRTANAPDACKAAGISPRKGASMLADPDIASEIARRTALSDSEKPTDAVTLQALISAAQRALALAERDGRAGDMIGATQTLARLTGKWDGDAQELKDEISAPPDTRDMSRTIIALLREGALATGWQLGFCGPGETLIRVPRGYASLVGGQPAYDAPVGDEQPATQPKTLAEAIAEALGPNAVAVLEAAAKETEHE